MLVSYVHHGKISEWCIFIVASEFKKAGGRNAEREETEEEMYVYTE